MAALFFFYTAEIGCLQTMALTPLSLLSVGGYTWPYIATRQQAETGSNNNVLILYLDPLSRIGIPVITEDICAGVPISAERKRAGGVCVWFHQGSQYIWLGISGYHDYQCRC